jgi:hypothetical protein
MRALAAAPLVVCLLVGLLTGLVRADPAEVPTTVGVSHGPTMPGGAVYPAQDLPLRFDHQKHLARGTDCSACHAAATTSRRAADRLIPTGEACDACHGDRHGGATPPADPAACEQCHTGMEAGQPTRRVHAPTPRLKFSHRLHGERDSACVDCHGDMTKVRLATTLQLPTEESCLTCHDGVAATQRCGACHPSGADGRLVTRAGRERAAPPLLPRDDTWGAAHDLAFVEDHAGIAQANPSLCRSCHDDASCQECHNGAVRPLRIHATDYLATHPLDARARTQDCQACHRLQSDCLACHERVGIGRGPDSGFGVGSGLRLHPEGWSGPPGMPQGHAFAAQRNLGACASCHDEDSCLSCHATTDVARPGLGVNPHGREFATSPRCTALAAANRRVCLKCHAPGDPQLECL